MSGRARRWILQCAVVSVLAVGCGSDGSDKENAGTKTAGGQATEGTQSAPGLDLPGDGPVVLLDDEGRLSVVDPGGGQPVAVEAPPVDNQAQGVAVRAPGIAFFETLEGELLLVDAIARTARVVGDLDDAGGALLYANNGGGRRFVAFTSDYGRSGLIVDIQAGLSRPVREFLPPEDGDSSLGTVRISTNEQFLFAEAGGQIRLVSLANGLAAAGAGTILPGDVAYFNADGTALFVAESVPKPEPSDERWDRIKRIPLDGSGEEVLVDQGAALLGVVGDGALIRQRNVHTLISHPGDGRTIDFDLSEGEFALIGQHPVDGTGLVTISNFETKEHRYGFLDSKTGSVEPVDALKGFRPAARPEGRFLLFSNFRLDETEDGNLPVGKGEYAVVDSVTGGVKTARFELGAHKVYPQDFSSPDGTRAAVSRGNEEGEPLTSVVSFSGAKPISLDAGFVSWAPSGSSFIGRRFVKSETAMHVFVAEQEQEREIAVGRILVIVWTAR